MVELLSTKLFIPPLRPDLVPRPRLILQIADNDLPRVLAYLAAAFQQMDEM